LALQGPYARDLLKTLTDPSLVPEGKHILSVAVKYLPYELKNGNWDEQAGGINKTGIDILKDY
jgi:phytoene dehydrogenase-like protein